MTCDIPGVEKEVQKFDVDGPIEEGRIIHTIQSDDFVNDGNGAENSFPEVCLTEDDCNLIHWQDTENSLNN